jgi:hypothetical protein
VLGQSSRRCLPAFDRSDARPGKSIADLNQLRAWIESKPEVPEGDWYKDFGSFKICGHESPGGFASAEAERRTWVSIHHLSAPIFNNLREACDLPLLSCSAAGEAC